MRCAGKSQKITITNDKGRLSKDEIERMVQVGLCRVVSRVWNEVPVAVDSSGPVPRS